MLISVLLVCSVVGAIASPTGEQISKNGMSSEQLIMVPIKSNEAAIRNGKQLGFGVGIGPGPFGAGFGVSFGGGGYPGYGYYPGYGDRYNPYDDYHHHHHHNDYYGHYPSYGHHHGPHHHHHG